MQRQPNVGVLQLQAWFQRFNADHPRSCGCDIGSDREGGAQCLIRGVVVSVGQLQMAWFSS